MNIILIGTQLRHRSFELKLELYYLSIFVYIVVETAENEDLSTFEIHLGYFDQSDHKLYKNMATKNCKFEQFRVKHLNN